MRVGLYILVLHPLHSSMCTQVIQMPFRDEETKSKHKSYHGNQQQTKCIKLKVHSNTFFLTVYSFGHAGGGKNVLVSTIHTCVNYYMGYI